MFTAIRRCSQLEKMLPCSHKLRMKCCSMFVYVDNRVSLRSWFSIYFSRVSLCSLFSIYFVDPIVFVLCALRAHVRCKRLINTPLHYRMIQPLRKLLAAETDTSLFV